MDIGKTILGMTLAFYTGFRLVTYVPQTGEYSSTRYAQRMSTAVNQIKNAADEIEKSASHIEQILKDIKVKRPELFEQREYGVPQGLTYHIFSGPARHTDM